MGRSVSRIYLDACVIIYLVEGTEPFRTSLVQELAPHLQEVGTTLHTSLLSRLECRVKPLRAADARLLAAYDAFLAQQDLLVVPLTSSVIDGATELRSRQGFKTPDAIHLATAITERADLFLTGDGNLAKCEGLNVQVVSG